MTGDRIRAFDPWTWSLAAIGGASYLLASYRQQANTVDDAYISFRFAQHLAEGHGLVWNVGGQPTEGYTNFLWVLILAGLHRVGLDLETIAPPLMLGATLATIVTLVWMAKRHLGGLPPLAVAVVALYLADPFTAVHTISGLETLLAVFLVTLATGAVLELLRRPSDPLALAAAAVFTLAILVRPDLTLFVGGLSIAMLAAWRRVGIRSLAISLGTTAGLLAIYAVWKDWYFGYLLPNPFYIKSAPGGLLAFAGLRMVLRFFDHVQAQSMPLWLPVLPILLIRRRAIGEVLADARRRLADPHTRAIALTLVMPPLLGWLYYATIIHEVGFASRFSYPTYPFVILWGVAIVSLLVAHPRLVSPALWRGIALIVIATMLARGNWHVSVEAAAFPADLHAPYAEALAATGLGPKISLHFSAAGLIPYRSGVNHVDPVGLTDNDLCGRSPLTRESYERLLWSRPADVYLSAEPPASPGSAGPDDDPIMDTPYMIHLLGDRDPAYALAWRRPQFGPTTLPERQAFLHRRMRLLRDEWSWLGEDYSETLWARLKYRLFVYVLRESPYRDQLVAALRPIIEIPAGAVDLTQLGPRRQ